MNCESVYLPGTVTGKEPDHRSFNMHEQCWSFICSGHQMIMCSAYRYCCIGMVVYSISPFGELMLTLALPLYMRWKDQSHYLILFSGGGVGACVSLARKLALLVASKILSKPKQ